MQIKIAEGEYEYTRPPLKPWLLLEDKRVNLTEAITAQDRVIVADCLVEFLSFALKIPKETLCLCPWYEVASAYTYISTLNSPKFDFPFLNSNVKYKKEIWDYKGRTWYIWANIFARKYNWNLDLIAELDVDDAIALAQEIAVDDQLDKEWKWMTSEIAYQTKEGFKPLDRPNWMKYAELNKEIPMLKIRKDLMPSGIIIRFTPPTD